MKAPWLRTERLLLRRWTDEDRGDLACIHADPEVMRHRFAPLSRQESDEFIDQNETSFEAHGFGLWAVERLHDHRLIGFTGLGISDFGAPFCPAIDLGWTLARAAWGHGYASEGAAAALEFAFRELQLREVVAHTSQHNKRSRAVMQRLNMTHDPNDDFDGPWFEVGHPQRRFVLYRIMA